MSPTQDSIKILLADDYPMASEGLRMCLEAHDHIEVVGTMSLIHQSSGLSLFCQRRRGCFGHIKIVKDRADIIDIFEGVL